MTEVQDQLELQRKHVAQVLEQLTADYQQAKAERKKLAELPDNANEVFTLLEELELLTVDIRGFGCQFVDPAGIKNCQEAISQLKRLRVFDVPTVARFYFDESINAGRMKLYVSLLDYLRLLILEYLQIGSTAEPVAA
jgi:hypothetical protein